MFINCIFAYNKICKKCISNSKTSNGTCRSHQLRLIAICKMLNLVLIWTIVYSFMHEIKHPHPLCISTPLSVVYLLPFQITTILPYIYFKGKLHWFFFWKTQIILNIYIFTLFIGVILTIFFCISTPLSVVHIWCENSKP